MVELDKIASHPEEYDVITTEEQKNPRFDRHMKYAESCSEKETLVDSIRVQAMIILKLGKGNIIAEKTRDGDVSLNLDEYKKWYDAKKDSSIKEIPEPNDKLNELDRKILELIYTRLSIHVM